jgi:hypothetical protein
MRGGPGYPNGPDIRGGSFNRMGAGGGALQIAAVDLSREGVKQFGGGPPKGVENISDNFGARGSEKFLDLFAFDIIGRLGLKLVQTRSLHQSRGRRPTPSLARSGSWARL